MEEGKDAKDGKSAKAKRSHFGRAVSLKNFILRKGKSTSVDLGEGTKEAEEEEEEDGGAAAEGGGVDGEVTAVSEEANDKTAAGGETPAVAKEAEKTQAEVPVTNGENSCSNGTAEETATHNHQEEQEEKMRGCSPTKKSKEAAGGKEEANTKIINATAAVNSGELEQPDSDQPQKDRDTNNKVINTSSKQIDSSFQEAQVAAMLAQETRGEEGLGEVGEEAESCDQGERGEGEEEEEKRKRDLREAAATIVQNVMSAATNQLERELCAVAIDNGVDGYCDSRWPDVNIRY